MVSEQIVFTGENNTARGKNGNFVPAVARWYMWDASGSLGRELPLLAVSSKRANDNPPLSLQLSMDDWANTIGEMLVSIDVQDSDSFLNKLNQRMREHKKALVFDQKAHGGSGE